MSETPIPVEEATSLVIPGEWHDVIQMYSPIGPWKWAAPILAIVSDSGKWSHWPDNSSRYGPYEFRVARSAIENLYEAGYALVKVDG
jgi:hypothetical protein